MESSRRRRTEGGSQEKEMWGTPNDCGKTQSGRSVPLVPKKNKNQKSKKIIEKWGRHEGEGLKEEARKKKCGEPQMIVKEHN